MHCLLEGEDVAPKIAAKAVHPPIAVADGCLLAAFAQRAVSAAAATYVSAKILQDLAHRHANPDLVSDDAGRKFGTLRLHMDLSYTCPFAAGIFFLLSAGRRTLAVPLFGAQWCVRLHGSTPDQLLHSRSWNAN